MKPFKKCLVCNTIYKTKKDFIENTKYFRDQYNGDDYVFSYRICKCRTALTFVSQPE